MSNNFLFLATLLLVKFSDINAHFDFSLSYCRFKCDSRCIGSNGDSPYNKMKHIKGYYWRDYHGVIPSDAFSLGPANQFPQTYIAQVFDKDHNGTFITTLVKGLKYVYSIYDGSVSKIDKHIQILCTMEPERLMWVRITKTNIATKRPGDIVVKSSHQYVPSSSRSFKHYIVKTAKCSVNYAGNIAGFVDKMEYALMDGNKAESKSFLWLVYRPAKDTKDKQGVNKNEPFFSHHYEYQIREGSLIPQFYKKIKIGSCSITCTNEGADSKKASKKNKAATAAMAYYWKPKDVFDAADAFKAGRSNRKEPYYIGQSFGTGFDILDVGSSKDGKSVNLIGGVNSLTEYEDVQIFSTQEPNKFVWVNSTSDTFAALDNSTLIPGGMMKNGTEIFVGLVTIKTPYQDFVSPGSIRVFQNEAICSIPLYDEKKFQVLMYKD